MEKKGILILFIFLSIFLIGLVSAESCSIVQRGACSRGDNTAIFGLSGSTNAHGYASPEATGANYVLCCNIAGSTTCSGKNKIIGLSSGTNAHAESPFNDNYGTDVCYGKVSASISSGDSCSAGYFGMYSLSGQTNAHIGKFSDYSTKVCGSITNEVTCDLDCSNPTPYCVIIDGEAECVECTKDSHCDEGERCSSSGTCEVDTTTYYQCPDLTDYSDVCDTACEGQIQTSPTCWVVKGSDCSDHYDEYCSYLYECGDGSLDRIYEECDDGNVLDGDGCSSSCQLPNVYWSSSQDGSQRIDNITLTPGDWGYFEPGNTVYMVVDNTGYADGTTFSSHIWEHDLVGNDLINGLLYAEISGGKAIFKLEITKNKLEEYGVATWDREDKKYDCEAGEPPLKFSANVYDPDGEYFIEEKDFKDYGPYLEVDINGAPSLNNAVLDWLYENKDPISDPSTTRKVQPGEDNFYLAASNLQNNMGVNFTLEGKKKWTISYKTIKENVHVTSNQNGVAYLLWEVSASDLDKAGMDSVGDEGKFKFTLNGKDDYSEKLVLKRQKAPNPEQCEGINYCKELGQEECGLCSEYGAATKSVEEKMKEGYCSEEGSDCHCSWDPDEGENGECKADWNYIDPSNSKGVGTCQYTEDRSGDTCDDDGFLSYSWNATWTWATENQGTDCTLASDCSGDNYVCSEGACRYDPKDNLGDRRSEKCQDGEKTVVCPAQIQLPFFNFYNLLATILVIAVIYVLVNHNKDSKKHKKKKKSKK